MSRKNKLRVRIPEAINISKGMTAQEYQNWISGGEQDMKKIRTNKYGNEIVKRYGLTFRSKKELKRYEQLLILKERGEIQDFKFQVKYLIADKVDKLFGAQHYVADYVVYHLDGSFDVEDTKGFHTALYRLKKHLLYLKHNILIKEIK